MMTPQARMAAAANPSRFQRSGPRRGVLHRAVAVHRDRDGQHPQRQEHQDPGRAVERHHVGRAVHAHPHLPHPAGRRPGRRRVLYLVHRLRGGRLLLQQEAMQLLGEGWNGHTWTTQPDATPVVAAEPAGIACRWAKDCMAVGRPAVRHDPGRALERPEVVRRDHQARRRADRGGLPRHRELHGRRRRTCGGKALAAHWNGKAWSDQSAASPDQFNAAGGRVLHGGEGLRRGRHGRLGDELRARPGPARRAVDRREVGGTHRPGPGPGGRYRGAQLRVVHLGHELHGRGGLHRPGRAPPTRPWRSSGTARPGRS